MDQLTNKETALLGLLSEQPMHAYEIEKQIKWRSMRDWTEISMSSVYKLLNSLEQRALVTSTTDVTAENRSRKVYTLTPTGKKALKAKIKQLISQPAIVVYPLDLGINNLHLLTNEEIKACFIQYQDKLDEQIKGYHDLEKFLRDEGCPTYRMGLASRPLALFAAEKEFIKAYLQTLAS